MERWAVPYQAMINVELLRRRTNPHDQQIVEAHKHRHALFLGVALGGGQVRTLCNATWNFYPARDSLRAWIHKLHPELHTRVLVDLTG